MKGMADQMISLRSIIPRPLISSVRLLQIFLKEHGHDRLIDGMPVDGQGKFLPWLTYPMVEFLNGFDFSEKSVFEFGAGASTLYWADRAKEVTSVELDPEWSTQLAKRVPKNVTLIHEPNGHLYASTPSKLNRKFDVIVIDGAERFRSSQAAIGALASGGMIILDNSEWYPNSADLLASSGLIEIAFSGFPPINAFCSTSSAFLSRDFAFSRKARTIPVGGKQLKSSALDDAW
jgi:predicted O-methyltransferase YrrM